MSATAFVFKHAEAPFTLNSADVGILSADHCIQQSWHLQVLITQTMTAPESDKTFPPIPTRPPMVQISYQLVKI